MVSKEAFLAFEAVRESGVVNMFDRRVDRLAGITKEESAEIRRSYRALCKEYLPERYAKIVAERG